MAALTAEDFGFTAQFLKGHPDVKREIDKAIAGDWTTTRALAAVKTTAWWKSRNDAAKRYDLLRAENPKEADRLLEQSRFVLQSMQRGMGFLLPGKAFEAMAIKMARNGLSKEEVQSWLGQQYKPVHGRIGQGSVVTAQILEMAKAYGIKLTSAQGVVYARQVLSGITPIEAYKAHFMNTAARLYPAAAESLKKGFTMRDIMQPYMEIAANELGVATSSMEMTDPRWTRALRSKDSKNTIQEFMTTDEWVRTIRTDKQYGWDRTAKAQQQAAVLTGQLAQGMGAMR